MIGNPWDQPDFFNAPTTDTTITPRAPPTYPIEPTHAPANMYQFPTPHPEQDQTASGVVGLGALGVAATMAAVATLGGYVSNHLSKSAGNAKDCEMTDIKTATTGGCYGAVGCSHASAEV